jgi:hypothetical protein
MLFHQRLLKVSMHGWWRITLQRPSLLFFDRAREFPLVVALAGSVSTIMIPGFWKITLYRIKNALCAIDESMLPLVAC